MNTATAAAVGTSLEVLAPYLPYGIEVQYLLDEKLYKLDGLVNDRAVFEYFQDGEGWVNLHQTPDYLLPVLRDFSQLTVPLPTGEVPAVEVMKWVAGSTSVWQVFGQLPNLIELRSESSRAIIKNITFPAWGWHFIVIDTVCGKQELLNPGAAYDYLRSKHFALPVNGRPLVANVDYIPLTAPSTPTREADNAGGLSENL